MSKAQKDKLLKKHEADVKGLERAMAKEKER